jgi:hypothetical protein
MSFGRWGMFGSVARAKSSSEASGLPPSAAPEGEARGKPVTVYLTPALFEAIRATAEEERRSLSQTAILALEVAFDMDGSA